MLIIAIEGLDKSGKHTQSNMLTEALLSMGFKAIQSEFPRYDTFTGKLIREYLTSKKVFDKFTFELIMTADKQLQQGWIKQLEDDGYDLLILDRYTLSQSVYSVASGLDSKWIVQLMKNLRKPDLDIVIDIPAEESVKRKGKHNDGNNDHYESDIELLNKVRDLYLNCSTIYSAPKKIIINGMKPVKQIHENIMKNVIEFIWRKAWVRGEITRIISAVDFTFNHEDKRKFKKNEKPEWCEVGDLSYIDEYAKGFKNKN